MEKIDKDLIPYRYALTFKRFLDKNKKKAERNKKKGIKDGNLIDSYGKLESSSGIPKASLIGIFRGDINPTGITVASILEAFGLSLTQFAKVYDKLTDDEVHDYRKETEESKKKRRIIR